MGGRIWLRELNSSPFLGLRTWKPAGGFARAPLRLQPLGTLVLFLQKINAKDAPARCRVWAMCGLKVGITWKGMLIGRGPFQPCGKRRTSGASLFGFGNPRAFLD